MVKYKFKYLRKSLFIISFVVLLAGTVYSQDTSKASYKTGEEFYKKKDYAKALDVFLKITKESPDSADAFYWLGNTNLRMGDYEEGIANLYIASILSPKYHNYKNRISYNEIPISMARLNYDGDELVGKISNGIRISGVGFQERASEKIINETTYPIWSEGADVTGFGVELSAFYSPVLLNIDYLIGEMDLANVKRRFALPPLLPQADASSYDTKVKMTSLNFSLMYTPVVLLWGTVYPSIGGCYVMSAYKHNNNTKNYSSVGAAAEIMIKYWNIFVKGGLKKGIDNKTFDNQLSFQFGFKISMFN